VQNMNITWDKRYLRLAQHIGAWSKDPSTQVGAVIIAPETGQVLSQGYNGFPRGIEDSDKRYATRDEKLSRTVHAEMNAVYNASLSGISLNGGTLYVHGLPICEQCSLGIIQVGIKKVVVTDSPVDQKWQTSCFRAQENLNEAGVKYQTVKI